MPYSGVIAEAVQSVAITSRVSADKLNAIGYLGNAGFSKKFGGVDVTIDAVMTDNVNVSGAIGYDISDFDNQLNAGTTSGYMVLYTTNSVNGRVATVSGLYVNSISFTFNANDVSTTSWSLVGDGVIWSGYDVASQGTQGNIDYHCINPLMWDEVHIKDGKNLVLLTGVQSITFTANFNRTDVFQIGQFTPYDRTVQYPHDVTVSINTLANDVRLNNWWDKFVPSYDPMTDCNGGLTISVLTNSNAAYGSATEREFIVASGLRPTQGTLNTSVGANSTVTLNFEGSFLRF